jgi:hypothetical protein
VRSPRYIRHLTLDTCDQRDSYRSEVAESVIAMLRPMLDRMVAGEVAQVPGDVQPACWMTARVVRGRGLLVTVSNVDHLPVYRLGQVMPVGTTRILGTPLLTFGVAPDSLASATLWREWIGAERDDRTPTPPWCVVQLMPGLAGIPAAAEWLGDLERCVAWAWIDS